MRADTTILIAEDDTGHFELIKRNLWRSCVENDIIHFRDGQEVLDFLEDKLCSHTAPEEGRYLLLLDIRMPKVDGREVLEKLKEHEQLRKVPVIMLTTTSETTEIERCYQLGCSFYMVKPTDYRRFMEAVENLGAFLSLEAIRVPTLDDADSNKKPG